MLKSCCQADAFRKKQNAKIKFDKERAIMKMVLADRAAGAFSSKVQLDKDGSGNFREQTAAKERQGGVAGPGFGRGAYFMDGGLVNLVDIYD